MSAIIGALRAELSASIAQFQNDMGKAADSLKGFSKQAEQISKDLERIGAKMSLAITAPLALLAKASYEQANQARQAIAVVEAALASSGNQSGKTADQLEQTAKALAHISTFENDDILRNVTANLLTFGNVQGQVFDRAQKVVVDLAAKLGEDLQGATIKVGRALNDPIQGVQALTRVGVQFTAAQREQIKALVQSGEGFKAQAMILDALEAKFGGAAKALRSATPTAELNEQWRDFKETIGAILLQILPPLIDLLQTVLKAFMALPEPIQHVVVIGAALLAILGPIIAGVGALVEVVGIAVPLIVGLAAAFAALGAGPVVLVIAAIATLTGEIVLFWKVLKDLLAGDFKAAWSDAKKTVTDTVDYVTKAWQKLTTRPKAGPTAVPLPGDAPKPGAQNFDLHNEDQIKKAKDAAETLQKQIDNASILLQHGLEGLQLPKATADANAFNARLDEFVKTAKAAGVNTAQFADQIKALRDRAADLQLAGLAKETEKFGEAVDDDTVAVNKFAKGGLAPLQEKLDQVDGQYRQLRDKILDDIKTNEALADTNDEAAASMKRLQGELAALETAHQRATKAANDQVAAEEGIGHLQSFGRQLDLKNQIVDLQQARGQGAPISSNAQDMQDAQRNLDKTLADAETKYQGLINQRTAGEDKLTQGQLEDLNKEIDLAKQYADLVGSTTADQIVGAKRINDAFKSFTDNLTDTLGDMIEHWSFDLKGVYNVFADLAKQLFLKPFLSAASDSLGGIVKGALGDLFGGAHAAGGYIPPGHWGIVGEKGPEPAFGGAGGMSVLPNQSMRGGGTVVNQYISTPDANSFRRSARQIQRQVKMGLGQ